MNEKEFEKRLKRFDREVIGYTVTIFVSLVTSLIVCLLFN